MSELVNVNKYAKYKRWLWWMAFVTIIAGVFWISLRKRAEMYQPCPINFLSKEQTQAFLKDDSDGYGRSLNASNLEACGVIHHQDLLDKWQSAAAEWKPAEIKKLQDACTIADYAINTHLKDPFKAQMNSISWQFAKTLHPYFCDGLPLTRADIIFLTDKNVADTDLKSLAQILVHEKVHLWERKYPEEMQGWMERHQFVRSHPESHDPLARSNPDTDGWIYRDAQNNVRVVQFRSLQPRDLFDVNYIRELEHPYEVLAYTVQKIVK
jgi:hypothetical protein